MTRNSHPALSRLALRVFVAMIGMNAAIAITVLIAGNFGDTGRNILLTSLCLTAAVMVTLACSAGRSGGRVGSLWPVGAIAAPSGFLLMIVGIWSESDSDVHWKLANSLIVTAVGIALVSLGTLATLPRRYLWTLHVAAGLTSAVVAMIVPSIWGDWQANWFGRLLGTVSVALAAFMLVIPVLHVVGAKEARPPGAGRTGPSVAFCPYCGQRLNSAGEGTNACSACGARLIVNCPTS